MIYLRARLWVPQEAKRVKTSHSTGVSGFEQGPSPKAPWALQGFDLGLRCIIDLSFIPKPPALWNEQLLIILTFQSTHGHCGALQPPCKSNKSALMYFKDSIFLKKLGQCQWFRIVFLIKTLGF